MHVIEKHLARSGQHGEREIIKERSCFTTAFVIELTCKKQNTTVVIIANTVLHMIYFIL